MVFQRLAGMERTVLPGAAFKGVSDVDVAAFSCRLVSQGRLPAHAIQCAGGQAVPSASCAAHRGDHIGQERRVA